MGRGFDCIDVPRPLPATAANGGRCGFDMPRPLPAAAVNGCGCAAACLGEVRVASGEGGPLRGAFMDEEEPAEGGQSELAVEGIWRGGVGEGLSAGPACPAAGLKKVRRVRGGVRARFSARRSTAVSASTDTSLADVGRRASSGDRWEREDRQPHTCNFNAAFSLLYIITFISSHILSKIAINIYFIYVVCAPRPGPLAG